MLLTVRVPDGVCTCPRHLLFSSLPPVQSPQSAGLAFRSYFSWLATVAHISYVTSFSLNDDLRLRCASVGKMIAAPGGWDEEEGFPAAGRSADPPAHTGEGIVRALSHCKNIGDWLPICQLPVWCPHDGRCSQGSQGAALWQMISFLTTSIDIGVDGPGKRGLQLRWEQCR